MMDSANTRLENIASHLILNNNDTAAATVAAAPLTVESNVPKVDVKALKQFFDTPQHNEYRNKVRAFMETSPIFKVPSYNLNMKDYRALVLEQLKTVADAGFANFFDVRDNIDKMCAFAGLLAQFNNNIYTLLAVHYVLYGGTLLLLGSERHAHFTHAAANLEIGCFAMTEIGHGSNVRGLETTATYCAKTQQFIINSPTPTSQKFWIGAAAQHARNATVFARLIVAGKDHGIHALVVPIRDSFGRSMPGVTLRDCGHKLGLNGIDNGQIHFDHVAIPRINLLNKFSDVTEDGQYKSQFKNPLQNFGATMGVFIAGRHYMSKAASGASKTCLTIAIRYAHERKQFGPEGADEQPLFTLPAHQRRLLTPLARTILMDSYLHYLARRMDGGHLGISAHAHCSGLKAVFTWQALKTFQICRESCGGQGFRSQNRIAAFKSDCDIMVTYEGDNTVLMIQVAKFLLSGKHKLANVPETAITSVNELSDLNKLHALFTTRVKYQVQFLKDTIKKIGGNSYDAFSKAAPWAMQAAAAYTDLTILENAIRDVKAGAPAPMAQITLFDTLERLEQDLGWFATNNLITPAVANQLPFKIMELVACLAPQALAIVDALAVPQVCLPSTSLMDGLFD
ncbi:hypothetical protein SAMD00019534_076190 [Acytostelium subglobosum LB1]|uniref:hypothetical protein n=1 Tax=Acytostelium subglobosum LB1 TaxID=1410327 RepID=UPI000644AF8D|nr:hypothetical protein SAMD00019534_076190 [Acytostelium subglobosum LB1]GAM24444.1 hypothetical protein SAMD00019534_076190 [Acytostelium subglobosum LB1]|eukprot:XP_012752770.1 hypothetical protein SAMD00019534_076190 [Acytostelium subglobosum LB1]